MIKRVVVLCTFLFACVQQPQPIRPVVQPTADEGEPVGFVTDSLTLQDLPTSQEVGLLDVILNPCRTEDGSYQRYNSTADARVNAVQFNAQIPTSTSLPSRGVA